MSGSSGVGGVADRRGGESIALLRRSILERGYCATEDLDRELEKWEKNGGNLSDLPAVLVGQGLLTPWQLEQVRQLLPDAGRRLVIPGYQILEKLGAGGAAVVYRARQLSLDRDVAIKVLHRLSDGDRTALNKLQVEGRAAAKLNHPNIVQAYDVGQVGNCPYFVMEYVQGQTVQEILQQKGRMEARESLGVVIQIARALGYAHEQGLIHCDIKPHNIVITANGTAKLADLGLARSVYDQQMRPSGRGYGTPYYISPEQVRGGTNLDGRADIYGLGCTFYHMVTGHVPFEGQTAGEVMRQHLFAMVVPPDHVCKSVPLGVAVVIEMMMAKAPEDRYRDAKHLLEDLEALERGEMPIHARREFKVEGLAALEPKEGQVALQEIWTRRDWLRDPLFWLLVVSVLGNIGLLVGWWCR